MAWTFSLWLRQENTPLSSDWQEWKWFKLEIQRNNRKLPFRVTASHSELSVFLFFLANLVILTTTLCVFTVYCKKQNMLHCISCLWLDLAEESGAQLPGRR